MSDRVSTLLVEVTGVCGDEEVGESQEGIYGWAVQGGDNEEEDCSG